MLAITLTIALAAGWVWHREFFYPYIALVLPLDQSPATAISELALEKTIPLGEVKGRIDHMAIDLGRKRLFIAELGNNSVGVVDLQHGRLETRLTGFDEPQGIAYVPGADSLFIANGGSGVVEMRRGGDLSLVTTIRLGDDADNVRAEPVHAISGRAEPLKARRHFRLDIPHNHEAKALGFMAERITVFARTDRFNPAKPCYSRMLTTTLPFPTDYTPALIAPSLRLFDAIWKPGLGFQKCGIMLTNLVVADRTKQDLFETRDPDRQLRLMRAVDALNRDYGARTIHFGYLGGSKPKSSLRANFISGCYTTSWSELRIVR